jgi:site-specific recombinase XerD
MTKVKVYFRQTAKQGSEGVVWISFYINCEKVNFSTKIHCEEKEFDRRTCRIRNNADKNLIIDNIISRINDVFVKFRLKDKKLTRDAFFKAFHRPSDYQTFFDFVRDYRKRIDRMIEDNTYEVHSTVIRKIEKFAPTLHFDDITPEWLDLFYAYLRKDLNNNENTAYKNMATLRKFVRAAWKAGYIDEYPFADWHIKRSRASYTFLDEQELAALIALYRSGELDKPRHQTLEFFLFQCLSSLHIGDAKCLKLEQFTANSFTYYRIKNRNSKPEPIVVPVSETLRQMITNIAGYRRKGLLFESLPADQTMNRYLKEIARMTGIDKNISHKTGRHTFATYFLRKTKDIAALKEILGHSELRETLIYAHVLDESKQEGIACFNDLL